MSTGSEMVCSARVDIKGPQEVHAWIDLFSGLDKFYQQNFEQNR